MSNYTIELRFLENEPISKIFDFNYTYYMNGLVSDEIYEQKKKDFERKFIDTYYFDEIGYETPDRFKQRLKNYLDRGFKIWNERFKTELEVEKQNINFLLNKDLTEERITDFLAAFIYFTPVTLKFNKTKKVRRNARPFYFV